MGGSSHSVPPDDFRAHQDLLKRVATNLGLQVEELAEPMDTLFNVSATAALGKVALSVHERVLKIAKVLWQTPSSILPTSKRAERKYFVPTKGFEYTPTVIYTPTHPPWIISSVHS